MLSKHMGLASSFTPACWGAPELWLAVGGAQNHWYRSKCRDSHCLAPASAGPVT